jgi:peptide-methionine (S)-S-oxide reductase
MAGILVGIGQPFHVHFIGYIRSFLYNGIIRQMSAQPQAGVSRSRRYQMQNPNQNQTPAGREVATLAGGCFWCLEAVYDNLKGVEDVVSGYAGGQTSNPSYHEVSSGRTGHAEVVQVTFDPLQISFREILEVFFSIHDPTTLNRQGADVGTQYRSAIFYHTPEQKATAEAVIQDLGGQDLWGRPIVTELAPFTAFYPAEDYHQEYFAHNPNQGYCQVVIAPKVAKFRKKYMERLKVA